MKAIIDVCGLSEKEITVSDIVFKIGPRINASGRIQNLSLIHILWKREKQGK